MSAAMMQALIGSGGAAPIVLSFVSNTTSASATLNFPAGVQAGDLAVHFDVGTNFSGAPAAATPAGFTNLYAPAALGNTRGIVSYKKLTGSESGALAGIVPDFQGAKCLQLFRGNRAITTVTPSAFNGQITDGDPTAQTVLASGGSPALVVVACAFGQTSPTFTTESPAFDAKIITASVMYTGYKIYNSSPVNHSIDMNDAGLGNFLSSGFISVS